MVVLKKVKGCNLKLSKGNEAKISLKAEVKLSKTVADKWWDKHKLSDEAEFESS